jgi:hypothetical protein
MMFVEIRETSIPRFIPFTACWIFVNVAVDTYALIFMSKIFKTTGIQTAETEL